MWAGSVLGRAAAGSAKRYNWAHCRANAGSFVLSRGDDEIILEPGKDPVLVAMAQAMEEARALQQRLLETDDEPTRQVLRRQLQDLMTSFAARMESEAR